MATVIALRRSGRASVIASTAPSRSTRTCSLIARSLESDDGPAATGYAPDSSSTKAGGTQTMKFFADTAEIAEIRELADTGLLDGVTTNPSLVHKSGRDFLEVVREIAGVVSGPVSAEVVALDYDGMMREAEVLRKIADNIAIKVPLTPAGLKACKALTGDGDDGQCDAVLLSGPGAACGQGRGDLHLAVRRPARRCRAPTAWG